jgi:hypothetical protein
MTMEEGSTIVMSSDSTEIMQSIDDSIAYFVDIDPNESSTLYRIDILVIGNDYQVDYIKGDLFNPASGPAIPDIPIGHLLIGKINIPPNTSEINKYMINTEFAEAVPKSLETINKKHYATLSSGDKKGDGLVAVFNEIMYPEGQPPPTQRALVDIVILDQYGNTFVAPEGGINLIARTINYEFYRDQINAIWISEGDDHAIGADRDVYKYLQVPPDGSGELLSLQGSNVTPAGGGFARLTNGYGGGSPEIASASYPNTPYSAIPFEYDNPSMISPNNKIPHHEIELRFSEGDVCMTTIEAWYAVSVSPLSSIIKIYVKEYPDISYTYPLYYFELFAESPSPFY